MLTTVPVQRFRDVIWRLEMECEIGSGMECGWHKTHNKRQNKTEHKTKESLMTVIIPIEDSANVGCSFCILLQNASWCSLSWPGRRYYNEKNQFNIQFLRYFKNNVIGSVTKREGRGSSFSYEVLDEIEVDVWNNERNME